MEFLEQCFEHDLHKKRTIKFMSKNDLTEEEIKQWAAAHSAKLPEGITNELNAYLADKDLIDIRYLVKHLNRNFAGEDILNIVAFLFALKEWKHVFKIIHKDGSENVCDDLPLVEDWKDAISCFRRIDQ